MVNNSLSSKDQEMIVDLRCNPVDLPTPFSFGEINCPVRNTSKTPVRALAGILTVATVRNSVVTNISFNLVADSYFHADMREELGDKSIPAGGEGFLQYLPQDLQDRKIKSMKMALSYVEFENGTTIGADRVASHMLAELRSAGSTYKSWLVRTYLKSGRPTTEIAKHLLSDDPLPAEIGITDEFAMLGTTQYRNFLRSIYEQQGPEAVEKLLKK
jgi:hypothetical protein